MSKQIVGRFYNTFTFIDKGCTVYVAPSFCAALTFCIIESSVLAYLFQRRSTGI